MTYIFLKILNDPLRNYKEELNRQLDNIFETNNAFDLSTAKNFRKKWFMPILSSLTFTTNYIRKGKTLKTCFNNGFIESMNNMAKLVKRNTYEYRCFQNLRNRILLPKGIQVINVDKTLI